MGKEKPGRPTDPQIQRLWEMVKEDPLLPPKELAQTLHISLTSVYRHLDLFKRRAGFEQEPRFNEEGILVGWKNKTG